MTRKWREGTPAMLLWASPVPPRGASRWCPGRGHRLRTLRASQDEAQTGLLPVPARKPGEPVLPPGPWVPASVPRGYSGGGGTGPQQGLVQKVGVCLFLEALRLLVTGRSAAEAESSFVSYFSPAPCLCLETCLIRNGIAPCVWERRCELSHAAGMRETSG